MLISIKLCIQYTIVLWHEDFWYCFVKIVNGRCHSATNLRFLIFALKRHLALENNAENGILMPKNYGIQNSIAIHLPMTPNV